MTVMSFNLRYNTPNDGANSWPYRIDRAAHIIRDHQPLIVGTQEGYHAMLLSLNERLEDYAWVGQGRLGGHENEHCAIFYKKAELDVIHNGQFWLSETPHVVASKGWDTNLPRICTWAHFKHRVNGGEFLIYNTHFDHIGQLARDSSAVLIWDHIRSQRQEFGLPVVLTGDFNSHPDHLPIRFLRGETDCAGRQSWLKDAYCSLPGEIGMTAHEFKGLVTGEPIDYIFVSPDIDVLETKVDRRLIDGAYPSDHYPVVSALRLSSGEASG
ncbi:endonuclease/exonuclease/phosphatase family protein [Paenibacillus piri]|uniref:Endonuclease/exonuclease/phosphatase family protein n=1 Tax=Paenibacillus piri TaxID=2547395 RepID=A0A4R5KXW5_9BACL|nr:endonuclease/exonuclease/phosphatase family protein [Paenibacillus piri]TDF99870.1 endonuclease/exonuclease/phosphatase family protein [Paenibacillus piri]